MGFHTDQMAIVMNRLVCSLCFLGLLITAGLKADTTKESAPVESQKPTAPISEENLPLAAKLIAKAEKKHSGGNSRAAKRLSNKIIRNFPESLFAAEALALKAKIYKENEEWIKCFNELQRIVDKHPQYQNFNAVNKSQFDCAMALMEGVRGRILWILPGFKQYSAAVSQFEQILENAPYSDLAPFALMNVALLSEKTGKTENAIDALDRLINYYPQSNLASAAYFNLADIYSDLVKGYEYDQGSTRRAISYYEDFLVLYPNSEYTGEVEANIKRMKNLLAKSRLDLGDFYYYYRSNTTAALVFYNESITIEPESDSAKEARIRIEDIESGVRPVSKASIVQKLLGVR